MVGGRRTAHVLSTTDDERRSVFCIDFSMFHLPLIFICRAKRLKQSRGPRLSSCNDPASAGGNNPGTRAQGPGVCVEHARCKTQMQRARKTCSAMRAVGGEKNERRTPEALEKRDKSGRLRKLSPPWNDGATFEMIGSRPSSSSLYQKYGRELVLLLLLTHARWYSSRRVMSESALCN